MERSHHRPGKAVDEKVAHSRKDDGEPQRERRRLKPRKGDKIDDEREQRQRDAHAIAAHARQGRGKRRGGQKGSQGRKVYGVWLTKFL